VTDREVVLIVVGGLIGLAGLVRSVVYLVRGARWLVHKLDAIDEVTQRELTHNHGTSMKDDVHGLALSIGELQRARDDERKRVNAVLRLAAEHHPEAAAMYLALRRD